MLMTFLSSFLIIMVVTTEKCWTLTSRENVHFDKAFSFTSSSAFSSRESSSSSSSGSPRSPRFTIEPPTQVTFTNNSGSVILCAAEGNPKPEITWTYGLSSTRISSLSGVRFVKTDGSLVFGPFSEHQYQQNVHQNTYQCHASNSLATISSRLINVKAVVHSGYRAHVENITTKQGDHVLFKCHLEGSLKEYVSVKAWIRDDGTKITRKHLYHPSCNSTDSITDDLRMIGSIGHLLIRNVTLADNQSSFWCQLEDTLNGYIFMSTGGTLMVSEEEPTDAKPRVMFTSEHIHAQEGSDLLLDCIVESRPKPSLRWYKLKNPGVEEELTTMASLTIRSAGSNDAGKYLAKVHNPLGQASCQVTVTIYAPLSTSLEVEKFNVEDYSVVTFNCLLSGYPLNGIMWLKDGLPLNQRLLKKSKRRGDNEDEDVQLTMDNRYSFNSDYSLSVKLFSTQDSGSYQCLAYNHFDSSQSSSFVPIKESEPFLTSSFEEIIIETNRKLELSCSASGEALMKSSWKVNEKLLAPDGVSIKIESSKNRDEITTSLKMASVKVENSGLYSCIFEMDNKVQRFHGHGHPHYPAHSMSRRLVYSNRVNVYGKPFVRDARVLGQEGQNMTINCIFGGYPISSIEWKKEKRFLTTDFKYHLEPYKGLLTINTLRKQDSGSYTCIVTGSNYSAEGTTHLSIGTAPLIDTLFLPESRVVEEGTKINLMCFIVKGEPDLHITWLKDNLTLISSEQQVSNNIVIDKTKDSSSIIFKSVLISDRGEYTCKASNKFGSDTRTSRLIVQSKPKWTIEPANLISASLFHRFLINCNADGYPSPNITWTRRKGIHQASRFGPIVEKRIKTLDNGSLLFDRITLDDDDQYSCVANNGITDPLIKSVTVKVNALPQLNISSESIEVKRGSDTSLTCTGQSSHAILMVWLKSKEKIKSNRHQKYTIETDFHKNSGLSVSTLTIRSASRQDDDIYICLAHNHYGYSSISSKITVLEKPWKPVDFSLVNISSRSIELDWKIQFDGNSPITKCVLLYNLITDASLLDDQRFTVFGALTRTLITNLRPLSTYTFRVACSNNIGISESSEPLNITTLQEAPEAPPESVRVQATGSQSLKVTWAAVPRHLQHGPILAYYIGYKIEESGETYQFKHHMINPEEEKDTKQFTIYLTNLKPLTRYWIVVQAYNQAGSGPLSDPVLGVTLETSPPISPVITVLSTTESSIEIAWERDKKDRSLIRQYVVYFREESRSTWRSVKIEPEIRSYVLNDLMCGTKYVLYMTATNSLGTGEPSRQVSTRTKGAAPVSPSKKSSVIWVKRSEVVLNLGAWNDGGCPIQYFDIKKRPRHSNIWTTVHEKLKPSKKEVTLRNLVPGLSYEILVTSANDAGLTKAEYSVEIPPFSSQSADSFQSTPSSSSSIIRSKNSDLMAYEEVPLYRNMAFVLPIGLSLAVIICLLLLAFWCINRSPQPIYGSYTDDVGKAGNSLSLSELSSQKSESRVNMSAKCVTTSNANMRSGSMASQLAAYSTGGHLMNEQHYTPHQYSEPYATSNVAIDPRECPLGKDHFATIKRGTSGLRPSQFIAS